LLPAAKERLLARQQKRRPWPVIHGGVDDGKGFVARWRATRGREQSPQDLVRLAFHFYHAGIYAVALRIADSPQDAEDVTQSAFERLAEHVDRLVDPERVAGFLKTTAVRLALGKLRRARWWRGPRAKLLFDSEGDAAEPDAAAALHAR
jgi:DNA-directed RNA polymerase specialized sigma24 family protein